MRLKLISAVFLIPGLLSAQEVLEEYVKYGLDNNLALQQKQTGYEKSLEALREARGLFYPSLSLGARYTAAEGGG